MRERMYQTYKSLQNIDNNYFVYFENNKRQKKSFKEFHIDVEECIARLNYLKTSKSIENVAILGPTSYQWVVLDHACIKGGFRSVAIPETSSYDIVKKAFEEIKIDLFLCDFNLKDKYSIPNQETYYFNCESDYELNFKNIKLGETSECNEKNLIREEYSIVFSSGTSEKTKYININYYELEPMQKGIIHKIKQYIAFRNSLLADLKQKNNKIIIFLPLSHQMQRMFIESALLRKINIVISDPVNCFKHIIKEKPNIMISVPPVYEAMASAIQNKLEGLNTWEKRLYIIFNQVGINGLSNKNIIKRLFQGILFSKINKIYGGNADLFVVGSAPSDPDTLKIFYSIGVKIYEAYGQSELAWVVSMNTPRKFKIGSVGKPSKNVKLSISDDSEILLKYDEKYDGLNKDILDIDENGFIHTHDIGYIDKDGFLFITGRKDDVIILDNGKKVHPNKIETIFKRNEKINHVLVYSKDNLKIQAIISSSKIKDLNEIQQWIEDVNQNLANFEKINSFYFTNDLFTVENGMLTSTLKMKRKTIAERYTESNFIVLN